MRPQAANPSRMHRTQFGNRVARGRTVAANAPLVVQLLKRFVDRTIPKGPSEIAGLTRREVDAVTASADATEGLAAFHGKRPPTFEGR